MRILIILTSLLLISATTYRVEEIRPVDADTFDVTYQVGEQTYTEERVRLEGVDAWEISSKRCSVKVTDAELDAGLRAVIFVWHVLDDANQDVKLITSGKHDRYGRLLGRIILAGEDLSPMLIKACHGIPYDGRSYGEPASGCTNPRKKQ